MDDPVRLEAVVRGRVQGVGFRYHVVREARRLGLAGWVANERDGSVRTIAEGSSSALDRLEALLRSGPPGSVIQGVSVPVYCVAKTVADCFRFRNRIGVNIAVEALRDAWRDKQASSGELWHYAKVCRVLNVMRPYFDSLA